MVKKFVYGTPFETEAVVKEIHSTQPNPDYATITTDNAISITTKQAHDDIEFALR